MREPQSNLNQPTVAVGLVLCKWFRWKSAQRGGYEIEMEAGLKPLNRRRFNSRMVRIE